MAKKTATNAAQKASEKVAATFTEMLIEKMETMQADYKCPWITGSANIMPRNMDGRLYNGMNALMLMLHAEKEGYRLPLYITFNKALDMGTEVKKGEKGFPVSFYQLNVYDENGQRMDLDDYNKLSSEEKSRCKVFPSFKYYTVFNLQQTTYPDVKPTEYAALLDKYSNIKLNDENGMAKSLELDYMLKNQTWVCPIETAMRDEAFYNSGGDYIKLPLKSQFISGEEFYGTLLHEMAHSTGHKDRLNRDMGGSFGSETYAKEELVAELTSAILSNQTGMTKGIEEQNVGYLQGWLKGLKEEPKFILSIMGDVNKAVAMIQEKVFDEKIVENIKNETMQGISDFLNEKAAEEQQKAKTPKLMTREELQEKTGSLNRKAVRFGEVVEPPVKETEKKVSLPENIELAYRQMKEKQPEGLVIVSVGNKFYSFDADAERLAGLMKGTELKQDASPYVELTDEQFQKGLAGVVRAGIKPVVTSTGNVRTEAQQQAQVLHPDAPKLHMGFLGNGIAVWEAGDDEYTAHISPSRMVTADENKRFHEANAARIRDMVHNGNIIVGNSPETKRVVLEPLKPAKYLHYNEMSGAVTPLSEETVDGKKIMVVADGSQGVWKDVDKTQCAVVNYPRDFTFNVSGVDNIRKALGHAVELGIDIKQLHNEMFFDVLSSVEETLDAIEKQSYRLTFQVNDGKITKFGRSADDMDKGLPNFYFKGNWLKFNKPGLGVEMETAHAMLAGDRIVCMRGIDNMTGNIEQLRDMGVTFKNEAFLKGMADGVMQLQNDKSVSMEDRRQATLYLMICDGVVVDSEPAIDETKYTDIPMYRFNGSKLESYMVDLNTINHSNKTSMEQKNNEQAPVQQEAKKQHADGVDLYKTKSNIWVVQEWKDGKGSPARAVSKEDLNAYFEAVKGQNKEVVTAERAKLAQKYLSPEAEKARAERVAAKSENSQQGRKSDFIPMPKVDDATRARITNAKVFTMSDGTSRAVRATIDGNDQGTKRIPDGLRNAFLKDYSTITPEEREERAVRVAAYAYQGVLKEPKVEQEQQQGMKR